MIDLTEYRIFRRYAVHPYRVDGVFIKGIKTAGCEI